MNYYISDTHFGHANIINFDKRPFKNTEEMERELINRWNSVVTPADTTYILGDFCWSRDEDEWIRILQQLDGQKVLILGNHDIHQPTTRLRKMFADIRDRKEITDNGKHVIMCHEPILLYKSSYDPKCYMLCGHVHITREDVFLEKWRQELRETKMTNSDNCGNIYNVGCMKSYMDYTPRTLDEIIAGAEVEMPETVSGIVSHMRDATAEERNITRQYIREHSSHMGVNFWDDSSNEHAWIPVEKRLPEDDLPSDSDRRSIKVLVCSIKDGKNSIKTMTRLRNKLRDGTMTEWSWGRWRKNITHWMPLVDLPQEE